MGCKGAERALLYAFHEVSSLKKAREGVYASPVQDWLE
jgi:hypothetical protein